MEVALHVAGVGMTTVLGDDTRTTLAALRAGERRASRAPIVDLAGDRIVGSFVLPVRSTCRGAERAAVLGRAPLRECIEAAGSVLGATALFVCAPLPWGSFGHAFAPAIAPVCHDWSAVVDALAGDVEARGTRVPRWLRMLIPRGHASGVLALRRAAELFAGGEASQALIVGLDTHGDRATLERLDLLCALRSRRSPGGFVPGEAAAVLCVRPAIEAGGGAVVRGLGVEVETAKPSTARALTSAVAHAMEGWGGQAATIGTVAIDLNGQRERSKEWSFAAMRTVHRAGAAPVLLHPADHVGDVGAASLPLLVGLLASDHARCDATLAVSSSTDGLRGAVVMGRAGVDRRRSRAGRLTITTGT